MPYLIADIIFDRHRGSRRFIAGEIERIKKTWIYLQVLIAGAGFEPATSGLWAGTHEKS